MKRLKLKWQVIVTSSLIISILIFVISLVFYNDFKDYHVNSLVDKMYHNSILLGESLKNENIDSLNIVNFDSEITKISEQIETRLTIISIEGLVLADSDYNNPEEMDNHLNRSEIVAAKNNKTGYSSRYSDTLSSNMLYFAYRLDKNSSPYLYIRMAIPLNEIDNHLRGQLFDILGITILGLILLITVNSILITKLLSPIDKVKTSFKKLSEGNYGIYIADKAPSSDIKVLIDSFNDMSIQLKENVSKIERRELELDTLIESMNSGLLFIDLNNNIKYINQKARNLLLYNGKENESVNKVVRNSSILEMIEKGVSAKEVFREEISTTIDQKKISLQVSINPIKKENIMNGIIVILHDISVIKAAEESRRDLIANVSHELRTPLTAISGFIETMKDMDIENQDAIDFLEIIDSETEKLKKLVFDLLELAKIETGNLKMNFELFDISGVVEKVVESYKIIINRKTINVENLIKENTVIYADKLRTEQIISNIIDNSIKYSDKNSVIKIDSIINKYVTIIIKDQGIGIDKSKIRRITEQFYREDASRSKAVDGYGLGLAIVKNLVELQNGELDITSDVNVGTTVKISFPRSKI